MTQLVIDTQDGRSVKALQIAAGAGQWIRCRTSDGRPVAFGVPSQHVPNTYYFTTTRACTCVDFKRRGIPCKHVQAVAIYCALRRAVQPRSRRRAA